MKKIKIIIWVMLFGILAGSVFAETIKTSGFVQNETAKPEGKESYNSQEFCSHWQIDRFGLGMNVITNPESNFTLVRPFMTLGVSDSFSLVGGLMTTSSGCDYVYGGIWFFRKFGDLKFFLDIREYFDISGNRSDYQDVFWSMSYPVAEKFSIGTSGFYDHWWHDSGHNQFLIGPVGYYHFSDELTFFCRPSYEFFENDGENINTYKFRVGVKFNF